MNRHEKIRLAAIERLCEMIDMAVEMKGEYFILHPGRLAFYSLSSRKVFFMEQRYPERIGKLFEDSLTRILGRSRGRIALCLENTHTIAAPFLKIVNRLVSDSGLYLVWDVGHTEQLGEARRQEVLRFFQNNIKYVKLAHLHDVKDEVNHITLGSGNLKIAGYLEIFNALSLDIILEIFPEDALLKSLDYLRNMEIVAKGE
jgi:sugar phosphate isomerase/epimerase